MIDNSLYNSASQFSNISRITLHRQTNFFDIFLFVEGDSEILIFHAIKENDKLLLLFPPQSIQDVTDSNKKMVIKTVKELNTRNISDFRGLVDNDFDGIMQKQVTIDNLIYTVEHDIETSFYKIDGLKKNFISKFLKQPPITLFDDILFSLNIMGSIRLLHEQRKQEGNFYEKIFNDHLYKYNDLMNFFQNNLILNFNSITTRTYSTGSRIAPITLSEYQSDIKNILNEGNPKWEIAHGHDLEKLLVRSIQLYGRGKYKPKSYEELLVYIQDFLVGNSKATFPETSLFTKFDSSNFII